MKRSLLFPAIIFAAIPIVAQEPPAIVPVDQRDFADSDNACGPATVMNFLKYGGPEFAPAYESLVGRDDATKMRFLVDRFFRNRPSLVNPTLFRWGVHGVDSEDLAAGLNELLDESGIAPLRSLAPTREEGEKDSDFLARIHREMSRSLANSRPMILGLRSYYVKRREENDLEPHWEIAGAHFVMVEGIGELQPGLGFELRVLDPWKARRSAIFLHAEANGQDFLALRGNLETGAWLGGRSFLQVLAPALPTLRPTGLEWSERYLVTANFLIGRF